MLDATPVGLRLVIIIDAVVIVAVPTGALVVLRRLFELVLGKVGPIQPANRTSAARVPQHSRACWPTSLPRVGCLYSNLVRRTGLGFLGGTAIGNHNGLRAFPERSYEAHHKRDEC